MDTPQRRTLEQRILRAGLVVGGAHLLFKLAGLVQAKAMGHYLSRETYDVSYAFAFESCIFGLFLIGEEVLGPAFMPVFMREKDDQGEDAAWRFANTVLTLQALVVIPIVALLMIFPEWAVRLWTAWTPETHPQQFALGMRSVRALAPALLGLSLGSTTYVLLNGYKRFFLAAFGDAVWKFAVVAALLTGVALLDRGVAGEALIWGLVAGSVLKVATHAVGLRDKVGRLRPALDLKSPAMRRLLWLALPLLAGIVFAKIRDAVNNVTILSELDSAGLMQANSMGRKLQGTIHWLVPYTLSIAVFPFFCELVDRDDRARLGAVVTQAGRMLLAVFVPFVAVVAVVAVPLTSLVFRGGAFDALSVKRTAVSMACYTLMLPASAIEALAMQAFFANRRMVAVTVVGIAFSALSIAISWMGLKLCGGRELLLLGIIAGGFALSRTLKSVTLIGLLRSSAPVFPLAPTLGFLARLALCALGAAAAAWLALRGLAWAPVAARLPASGGHLGDLIRLAAGGGTGLLAAVVGYAALRIREPLEMLQWARQKIRRRS
jgi:putative peptidoglycan lipid II flippase